MKIEITQKRSEVYAASAAACRARARQAASKEVAAYHEGGARIYDAAAAHAAAKEMA